jgi:hypothetical protein
MDTTFEMRVRTAATAGWWTLLIGAAFLTLQWILFLLVMSARPAWILSLWGGGLDWENVRNVWFWGAAVFKLCLWLLALAVVWLTLWARQLRKNPAGSS